MKKLVIRDYQSQFGTIALSWRCQFADGEWSESPQWGLLPDASHLEKAQRELREQGHEFEVEDLRK